MQLISSIKNTRHSWAIDLLGLAVVFGVFYFLYLGSYPLFTPDEGRYSEVAREMVATGDYITPRVNGVAFLDKPILYYWLQAAAIYVFGVNEWAVRFFPALIGIIGCLVTYACGRQLFNRRTGMLSALILASSPLYFSGAHYANLDLEIAVFISCTLLCFITALQTIAKARTWLLFSAYTFAALAMLTKVLIGVAFPAMIAGAWIILLWRWTLLKKIHLVAGIILFIALVLPWYILAQRANPEFLHFFFVTQQVTRFLSGAEFNNQLPIWFYAPVVLIGFFPWVIFLVQAISTALKQVWRNRQQHAVELYLLLWIVIIFTFFSIPHSKIISYMLPIFPALALLTGKFISDHWENAQQASIRLGIVIFTVTGSLLGWLLLRLAFYPIENLSLGLRPYLIAIAMTFIISVLASLCTLRNKKLISLFSVAISCSAVSLLTLTLSATQLNQNTAKPLIIVLKTVIKPEDEVANYYKFYQDVPIYLERRITLVADWQSPTILQKDNWIRELWFGMAFQKTDEWLINENTFWQRWHGSKRMFTFVNDNYLDQFKAGAKKYYLIGKYNDILLFSNRAG